jgi:hypothetical protein
MNDGLAVYVLSFLVISFVASFVMNGVRSSRPRELWSETMRLFSTIAFGILAFSLVIWVLEWIFIRPLV